MIGLTSDVECGNGKAIEQVAADRFRLQVDGDKQSGYCAYFCFDIINEGPAANVTIELWEDAKFESPPDSARSSPRLFGSSRWTSIVTGLCRARRPPALRVTLPSRYPWKRTNTCASP